VVVRDVPDGKVVVGNPARIIGDVADLAAYQVEEILGAPGTRDSSSSLRSDSE
jgi:serine acetyltransferase